ncbi:unnamed protein product [Sympodiomycopsis kandeliae]
MTSIAETLHHFAHGGGLNRNTTDSTATSAATSPASQHHQHSFSLSGLASSAKGGARNRTQSNASERGGAANRNADSHDDDDQNASGDDEEEEEYGHSGQEAHDMLNEQTVKSGYLWKKGEKRKTWKKRWFVLRSSKLYYYKNDKEYQLLRFIDMSEVHSIAAIQLKRQDNTFGIVTPKRAYYVKASTPVECQQWIRALNDIKTQLSQRNTMTHDFADLQMTSPTSTSTAKPSQHGASPGSSGDVDVQPNQLGASSPGTQPASSPGQSHHATVSQPRAIPQAQSGRSPLLNTTDSDNGAEQFGLSYTSSATGHSFSSSPGRDIVHNMHSGSDLSESGGKASRGGVGIRQRGQGSSSSQRRDGHDLVGGAGSSYQSTSAGGAALLSSSEEEDDVDENEVLDQAMPLPRMPASQSMANAAANVANSGSTTTTTPRVNSATSSSGSNQSQPQQGSLQSSGDALLRDPNRVIVQGYLMKQSNRRKTWRKRWFVLTSSSLLYTRSHMDSRAHRQIPLGSILDAIEHTSKKSSSAGGSYGQSPPSQQSGGGALGFHSLGSSEGSNNAGHDPVQSTSGSNAHDVAGNASTTATSSTSPNIAASSAFGLNEATSPPAPALPPSKPERRGSMVAAAAAAAAVAGVTGGSSNDNSFGNKRMDNCFKILTPKRVFLLCAPTEEEEIKWLSALQALLTRSRGQQQRDEISTETKGQNPPSGGETTALANTTNTNATNTNTTTNVNVNTNNLPTTTTTQHSSS